MPIPMVKCKEHNWVRANVSNTCKECDANGKRDILVRVKSRDKIYKVLAIDFAGIIIRKGQPSVIVEDNEGCVPLTDIEFL